MFLFALTVAAAAAAVASGGGLLRAWRAEAARQDGGPVRNASDPVTPESVDIDGDVGVSIAQSRPDGQVRVFVELNEAPTAQVYADVLEKSKLSRIAAEAAANQAAQAQLSVIRREQGAMAARLASSFGVAEMYRTQRVLNGIAVTADAAQVEAIRATPGVKDVLTITEHFPTNSTSVPFIRAPQLWDNSLGILPDLTGRNVKVGIIDTGIDYLHGDFGGPGTLAAYTANNRTTNADGFFPTAKVVGGFDFAGDNYTASNSPVPDPDPMDCNGHGSHVAGTAAGLGVLENGTGFTGPYGVMTPFGGMRIGPGVAPGASLYALRVFGCAGGTFLTTQAIEWSVDPNGDGNFSDHLDVINMSLGGTYGNDTDASAAASNNAVLAGVIVVTSAGNDADTYFIHGSPGTAKRAISTAASSDNGQGSGPILRVNSPPSLAGDKTATVQRNWGVGPTGQTANVVVVNDGVASGQPSGPTPSPTPVTDTSSGTTTDACQPLTPASAAAVAGKIALADRGLCSIKTKTFNVQTAGAIGLIVNNNNTTDTTPPVLADDQNITAVINIPTVLVLKPVGDAIKAEPNGTVNVTLLSMADTMASFSSRGPRRGGQPLGLKPDITAPGLAITSVQTGTTCPAGPNTCQTPNASGFIPGNQSLVLQGTSMAAPHIAGFMALLRQLHPDWTVEELKALAMNGAVNDLFTLPNGAGTRYGLSRIGAGRADAVRSATNTAVAYDADDTGAVSVSAFENEVVGTVTGRSRTIRVVNKGTTDVTYTLGLDTVTDAPGVSFSLPGGNSLTVPAGQARTFTVAMNAVADQMDHVREATEAATQLGNGRQYLTEEGAYVTFTADSQVKMRVPVYAAPRPASQMQGTTALITGAATSGQASLALGGQDVCTGTRTATPDCTGSFPTDVVSLVTPFELQVNSPAKGGVPPHSDLHHVGVSADASNIYFGLSSYGDWTWPSDVEFDIYIDTNEDGTYDRVAFNSFLTNSGAGVRGTDVFVTAVLNAQTFAQTGLTFLNGAGGNSLDTAIYNNNVMVMAVPISSLGFTSGDTSFRYRIDVFDQNLSGRTDAVGRGTFGGADSPLTFNYAAPGLNFPATASASTNSAILFVDMNGRTIPTNFNKTNLTANRSLGGLLLHHHNARGTRDQVFAVQDVSATTDIGVGVTVNNPNPPLNTNVNITVTAQNVSSNNATGVSVLDQLPAGLQFVSATPSVGTYNSATGIWNIGALNAGASATLQIVATVKTTDPISNTARVAGSDQLDLNPTNDQATAAVTAPRTADLGVAVSASAASANPGQSVTYTVTLTNAGEDTANNVVVNFALSPAATITAATPSTGVFNTATGVWNVAGIGKNGSATLTVTVTVPVVCGSLTATATIASADTADTNSVNNSATATVAVGPAATVQFDQTTYVAQEDSTALNVVVTRTGDATIPVTVNYTTVDGTASSRSDYNTAVGKLTFASGETSKTITVLLNEDSLVEGTETFTVTLSNPSVCQVALGSPNTATVQINDDASEPSTNPIDDSTNFVRQHYHDFLNREPDAPGLAFWVNGIESCGADAGCREVKRIDTSAAFFLSIEFQGTGGFVYHAYTAAFGPTRIGSTVPLTLQEFLPDAQQVGNGVVIGEAGAEARLEANKQAYLLEFVQRAAFTAQYPNSMTPAQFVDALNANTGNSLTQSERDALVAQLSANNTTQGRADVLRKVIDNAAFQARERNRSFVLMQYFGYLRRNPNDSPDSDFSGYNFWLSKLNEFNGDFRKAEMVKAFISSAEYRKRFGQN